MQQTTREKIRKFNEAFKRPVNHTYTHLSAEDRILLGKLLIEEAVEYVTKGLGLTILVNDPEAPTITLGTNYETDLDIIDEGNMPDDVEILDGLADVNVIIHFNAHWHGFDLDRATDIVNDSNMSKLDNSGQPIINDCKYWIEPDEETRDDTRAHCRHQLLGADHCKDDGHLIDMTRPRGKILKSAGFYEPGDRLRDLIETGTNSPELEV